MSLAEYIEEQKEETREIIAEMLQDGLDSDAAYMIEHHFAADNLAECEALTLDARSMGYEVNPAEEYELDPEAGEGTIFCFDVYSTGVEPLGGFPHLRFGRGVFSTISDSIFMIYIKIDMFLHDIYAAPPGSRGRYGTP